MVGPAPFEPYTFRALAKTFGTMWLRCDVCRRYAKLQLAGLHDIDYRTKTFSCSRCGAPAYLCVVNPSSETGMEDYRLDALGRPPHHPNAIRRLSGAERPRINFSGLASSPVARSIHAASAVSQASAALAASGHAARAQIG
jgi:hypothetical protein